MTLLRIARQVFTVGTVAVLAGTFAQLAYYWPKLPQEIPARISSDGSTSGVIAAWTLLLPPMVEAAVLVAALVILSRRRRRIGTELGWSGLWFAILCGYAMISSAQNVQIHAALHPGAPQAQWVVFPLIVCIFFGILVATVDFARSAVSRSRTS